jgi:hypothetical protein
MNGLVYSLSLASSFNSQSNLTALFKTIPKTIAGVSNMEPNYEDGAMFASHGEFILYGWAFFQALRGKAILMKNSGQAQLGDNNQSRPVPDEVLTYGTPVSRSQQGFEMRPLPSGVHQFITNGAAVSAHNEQLSFYFSGMHVPDWQSIIESDHLANLTANTLITAYISVADGIKWENDTLPQDIPGRANAELVWIPVSQSGILVAIGGVIFPESLTASRNLTKDRADESVSAM